MFASRIGASTAGWRVPRHTAQFVRRLCSAPKPASTAQTVVSEGGRFPGARRQVGYWLLGCASMVFGMVVLGGATRLTRSGLSMVEWKPTTFTKPSTQAEWEAEFAVYKQYPEFQRVNKHMTVEEFKVDLSLFCDVWRGLLRCGCAAC